MNFLDEDMKRERSPLSNANDRDRSRRGDRPSRFGPRSSSPNKGGRSRGSERRIFVSNVAYEYRWQELKDLFRSEVGEVSFVQLFNDENSKPRGCGIIEFESVDSVTKAVEKMHRYDLKGRKLVVKEDYDVERDQYGRARGEANDSVGSGPPIGGGGGGGNRNMRDMRDEPRNQWDQGNNASYQNPPNNPVTWGNTYGLSPQFLEDLGINGPLVTRVFVANLDYKVDQKKLKEVFKLGGRVINAELHVDRDGKSRGFGVIEYDHPVEAVQAISMFHNQMLFERKMTVRMDRVENKIEGPPKLPEGLRSIGMGLGSNGSPLKDVARNLPSLSQGSSGLMGSTSTNNGAANLNANLTAAALSNAVNVSSLGLGNSGGLQLGLGGLGSSLMNSLGDVNNLNSLNANLSGGGGGFGNASLGSGLNLSGNYGNMNAGSLGGGNFGGNNNPFIGGGSFPGNSSVANFANVGRDLGSLNAALLGGGFNGGDNDRDSRRNNQGSGFLNNVSRTSLGGTVQNNPGNTGNGNRTSDTIIVKNLPLTTTWQVLKEKFRVVGEIKYAEMRAKDVGLVRFNTEWEAERAVHMMDRKRLDGREIEVGLFF